MWTWLIKDKQVARDEHKDARRLGRLGARDGPTENGKSRIDEFGAEQSGSDPCTTLWVVDPRSSSTSLVTRQTTRRQEPFSYFLCLLKFCFVFLHSTVSVLPFGPYFLSIAGDGLDCQTRYWTRNKVLGQIKERETAEMITIFFRVPSCLCDWLGTHRVTCGR